MFLCCSKSRSHNLRVFSSKVRADNQKFVNHKLTVKFFSYLAHLLSYLSFLFLMSNLLFIHFSVIIRYLLVTNNQLLLNEETSDNTFKWALRVVAFVFGNSIALIILSSGGTVGFYDELMGNNAPGFKLG